MFANESLDQEFNPTLAGIWVNDCFLIRRIISRAIQEHANLLHGKILDYGCGSKPYERFFVGTQYLGIDLRDSGHPNERKKADVYFEGSKLPFPSDEFDGILASEVFEHVFQIEGCLDEIYRVLKPGGRLVATCPFVWPLHEKPFDFARYTPFALNELLIAAGFEVKLLEQRGSASEAIIQMFIVEILPSLLWPIRRVRIVHRMVYRASIGFLSGLGMVFGKLSRSPSNLYLSNFVVAQKKATPATFNP